MVLTYVFYSSQIVFLGAKFTYVYAKISGNPVTINAGYSSALDTDCVLGIRPEALKFATKDTPNSFPVTVEAEIHSNSTRTTPRPPDRDFDLSAVIHNSTTLSIQLPLANDSAPPSTDLR